MHEGSSSFTELRACVPCVRSHACAGLRSLRINTTARMQAVMAAQAAAPLFFRVLSIPPIIKEYHLINYFSRYGQVLNVYLVCLYSSSVPSYHCSSLLASSLISSTYIVYFLSPPCSSIIVCLLHVHIVSIVYQLFYSSLCHLAITVSLPLISQNLLGAC